MAAPDRHAWEFSVVIPFFQRKRGILRRAVESALGQQGISMPRVIVVDDGSPVGARDELQDLLARYPRHLVVLRQENGGAGAARNAGMVQARADSEFIAFLDSDDSWLPLHLKTAKRALDLGSDFYFCDALHRDGRRTVLQTRPIPSEECRPLGGDDSLFEFTGDLLGRVLQGRPMQIPAFVYRSRCCPLMFRTDLRMAQDHFLFMQMATLGRPTAFSTAVNVRLGEGVNNYNAAGWGTPHVLQRIFYDQLCIKDAAREFAGARRYRPLVRRSIRRHRRDFVNNAIAVCNTPRRAEAAPIALKYLALDPLAIAWVPVAVLERIGTRLRH